MRKRFAAVLRITAKSLVERNRRKNAGIPGQGLRFLLQFVLVFAAASAGAQDVPRLQVFGGYSYLYLDGKPLGLPNSRNLNGYTFSPAFNITHRFGVTAEIAGQYNSVVNFRDLAFGGQFLFPYGEKHLFFARALFFDARSFVSLGAGAGNTSRAIIGGVGMDYPLSTRFSWRVLEVDYVRSMLFNTNQNNARVSTGFVYHWKTIHYSRHKKDTGTSP
ncbi:MAG TPA: hypothetical protein VLW84_03090 [Terriglobales bacterium]|nr:hypothetical protein [Terriglobales bacterium]